jgi:hypothetical protein
MSKKNAFFAAAKSRRKTVSIRGNNFTNARLADGSFLMRNELIYRSYGNYIRAGNRLILNFPNDISVRPKPFSVGSIKFMFCGAMSLAASPM